MPLLFLLFNQEKEAETGKTFDRLFDTLLNYVLSPALLAYAVILYLYLLKILVLWSLPKGGVAYIVTFFVSALFLFKGCQPFLKKRYYDWLYRHASGVAFPTMLLYWVGACYRIHQYGYTEARVYLVVAGVILTGMVLLFFTRRTGRYWYVACLGDSGACYGHLHSGDNGKRHRTDFPNETGQLSASRNKRKQLKTTTSLINISLWTLRTTPRCNPLRQTGKGL